MTPFPAVATEELENVDSSVGGVMLDIGVVCR